MNRRVLSGTIPSPAPGADWSYVFSQFEEVRLLSLLAQLVNSATVATRFPDIRVMDTGGNVVYSIAWGTGLAAGLTEIVCLSPAFASVNNNSVSEGHSSWTFPFPDFWLPPGWKLASSTLNIQTTDAWSGIAWAAEFREMPADDGALATYLQSLS